MYSLRRGMSVKPWFLPPLAPVPNAESAGAALIAALGDCHARLQVAPGGDTALVVEFGDCIDRRLSERVLALARRLNERSTAGVVECVPTFRSLMVHYDPLVLPAAALTARIAQADARTAKRANPGRHVAPAGLL